MNVDKLIQINRFGQDLLSINDLLRDFQSYGLDAKRDFLKDVSSLLLQSKIAENDIDLAIQLGNLKPTFTPCIKIRKGVSLNILNEIIGLPEDELTKSLILFLSLFKISYNRLREKEKDNPNKWWYQDLSSDEKVNRIKQLSEIKMIIQKLHNSAGQETGSILSAVITFPLNLFEKNILERQLELYAFNNLYQGSGLNIYTNINTDTASLIIIKDINNLAYTKRNISIY